MRNGLTLIELLACIAILGLLVLCLYLYAISSERAFFFGMARGKTQEAVRDALDLMMRDIRHAGYRRWNGNIQSIHRLDIANETAVRYQADLSENDIINESGEDITYRYFPNEFQIRRFDPAIGDWEVVAEGIANLRFTYFDANNAPIPNASLDTLERRDLVRRIRIDLRAIQRAGNDTVSFNLQTGLKLRNINLPSR